MSNSIIIHYEGWTRRATLVLTRGPVELWRAPFDTTERPVFFILSPDGIDVFPPDENMQHAFLALERLGELREKFGFSGCIKHEGVKV